MKSEEEFVCCEKCAEFLGRESATLVVIWLELCAEYLKKKHPLSIRDQESEALMFLEKHGYITTTESNTRIYIKPNGYHVEARWDTPDFFCVCPEEKIYG